MQIRPAVVQDKPAIITLLKQSLGESTIPKSEALWNWKHEQNPFGASYVLVAEEGGDLIGVRAFMQWDWLWGEKEYKAIRAVDTATHPKHSGKGIFKKLTLQQAALCKEDGINFIFNTPNEQSKHGYLKMGWVEQGRMPLKFAFRFLPAVKYQIKGKKKEAVEVPLHQFNEDLFTIIKASKQETRDKITTKLSPEYLQWRYTQNPLYRYHYFTDNENYLIITRIKSHSLFRELRITDFTMLNHKAGKDIVSSIKKDLTDFCRKHDIGVISLSGNQYTHYKSFFNWLGVIPVVAKGPMVTLKDLNMKEDFSRLMDVTNWSYSLGDMELF